MEWLERLKKSGNGDLEVTYKPFVLEQANFASRHEPGWKIWEDKLFPSRDVPPLLAAQCAAVPLPGHRQPETISPRQKRRQR